MAKDEIVAELAAAPVRRGVAVASMLGLAVMLGWIALDQPMRPIWRGVLALGAVLAVAMADRMRQATALRIELTREALRDSSGMVLARLDEIDRVERGAMSLKPSNGFAVILKRPADAAWRPGLWWRAGDRIGVGGVTAARDARAMAERLTALLAARRDQDDSQTT